MIALARVVCLSLLTAALVGCSFGSRSYSDVVDLTAREWSPTQSAVFEFAVSDTERTDGKISVILRAKAYLNLHSVRLTVKTTAPDRLYWVDTLNIPVATAGSMPLIQSEAIVRQSIRFARSGNYNISISPIDTLTGVVSVGLLVEGAKEKNN